MLGPPAGVRATPAGVSGTPLYETKVDDWLSSASIEDPGTQLGVIERRRG